jgi:outer membrane protein OmpA-like peptidoglycan-associated protein
LRYPDEELIIEGYGDSSKTDRHNINLSKLRANIVKGYFVKREISNSRIKAFWMGSENLARINVSQEDKIKTHQVEVKFNLRSKDDLKY